MKYLLYISFVILYILAAFFGIGPVILADGSFIKERTITFIVVLIIFVLLTIVFKFLIKRIR